MASTILARLRSPLLARPRWRAVKTAAADLMRAGRFEEADRVLVHGLAVTPAHPELLVEYALSAHDSGRYALAIERWETALRVAPHKPMCHAGLAANLREAGALDRATAAIEAGLTRFPRHVAILTEAARVAAAKGRFETALDFWRKATGRPRPHPDWLQGHAQTLAILGRFKEAQALVDAGRESFPLHRGLCGVEGLLASAQEDWPRAIAHWRWFRRQFPNDPTGWEQLGNALQGQALAHTDRSLPGAAATAVPLPATIEVIDDEPTRQLMLRFESLGDNCELGLVQRRYGAEPLGLLRWNTVGYDQLLVALKHRFEGMGEPGHTMLTVAANGEFFVEDRRWYLGMHTFLHAGQADPDVLAQKMSRRVAFLRDKLVADLAQAEKIFVFRSAGLDEDRLAALHAALRAFGPVTLLAVQPTEPAIATRFCGAPGQVVEVAPGCLIGFLSRLGVEAGQTTWRIEFDDWLAICRRVAVIVGAQTLDDRLAS